MTYQITVTSSTAKIIADKWTDNDYQFDMTLRKAAGKGERIIEVTDAEFAQRLSQLYGTKSVKACVHIHPKK